MSPALAGDRALIDFIGFSPDAKYFAFEEYGIQDGSGFPYSTIYVIDLANDAWVKGTPFRARAEDEYTPLLAIRAEAMSEAFATIDQYEISAPVDIAALIGDGVPDTDAKTLAFGRPGYEAGAVIEQRQLTLTSFPATSLEDCSGYFGSEPLGFALELSGGAEPVTVHRDEGALPRSRGCPLDYRLYAVVLPALDAPEGTGVAIVSVYPGGFEGPDRRFLAVPFAF
ncbi:hypothetical protein VW35_09160 [Devosia soli]|uniref:DUF2259 domain-containing protein n=2 Tax=Devosia soli TaxID=361041 RepID=A0A0F5L8K8_9HYPH|nr:hypothetical protein VW35_09160 [Devosia soli]